MLEVPKISIITVVFNGESLIERTIKSVLEQTFASIEYIIVDGLSNDGTLSIAKQYSSSITKIISEKDHGIYDAMNKGLKMATGNYILFLNAGDELYAKDTLSKVFENFINADVYYGNTAITNNKGDVVADRRLTPPLRLTWKSFKFGMCVSHQSFIAKRILCDYYNLNYPISSDIDWVINILKKSNTIINSHIYISKFLAGGAAYQNTHQALWQRFKIMLKHYGYFYTLSNHVYIILRYPIHKFTHKFMT